jgi:hypothetical protein
MWLDLSKLSLASVMCHTILRLRKAEIDRVQPTKVKESRDRGRYLVGSGGSVRSALSTLNRLSNTKHQGFHMSI